MERARRNNNQMKQIEGYLDLSCEERLRMPGFVAPISPEIEELMAKAALIDQPNGSRAMVAVGRKALSPVVLGLRRDTGDVWWWGGFWKIGLGRQISGEKLATIGIPPPEFEQQTERLLDVALEKMEEQFGWVGPSATGLVTSKWVEQLSKFAIGYDELVGSNGRVMFVFGQRPVGDYLKLWGIKPFSIGQEVLIAGMQSKALERGEGMREVGPRRYVLEQV